MTATRRAIILSAVCSFAACCMWGCRKESSPPPAEPAAQDKQQQRPRVPRFGGVAEAEPVPESPATSRPSAEAARPATQPAVAAKPPLSPGPGPATRPAIAAGPPAAVEPQTQPAAEPAPKPAPAAVGPSGPEPATRPAPKPAAIAAAPREAGPRQPPKPVAATRPAGPAEPVRTQRPTTRGATPGLTPASALAARDALAKQPFDDAPWARHRRALDGARDIAPALRKHLVAGDRALARGDYKAAVEAFYRAFDVDPHRLDTLQGLAVALTAAKRYREAVDIYRMVLALDAKDATTQFNLAVALSRLGRFAQAEEAYWKLLRQDEDRVRAWYNLATLYQAQGKLSQARGAWEQVTSRAAHLETAHSALGEVLIDLGQPAEAMKAFAAAAKLNPKAVSVWLNLAAAARAAGSYGKAVMAIEQAKRLAPQDAGVFWRLGQVLLELHRRFGEKKHLAEALAAWRKSLELQPNQPQLRELVKIYSKAVPAP